MEERSVWKERIEEAEEPIPGGWGSFIAEWVGGDIGFATTASLFAFVVVIVFRVSVVDDARPSRIDVLNFFCAGAPDDVPLCPGRGCITPNGNPLSFFCCEFDLRLIGSEKLPLRFGFSFSGVVSMPERSRATSSGDFSRKDRSDMLLPRRWRPGRSPVRDEAERRRWRRGDIWVGRSCWEAEWVDARLRAAAAAAAERLDWTLLLRESIAREAARVAGWDCAHGSQWEGNKAGRTDGEGRMAVAMRMVGERGLYTHDDAMELCWNWRAA